MPQPQSISLPSTWADAKPHEILMVRKSDLEHFLGRLTVVRDSQPVPRNHLIGRIQRAVADAFSIDLSELVSRRRPAHIAWPRQIAVYLSHKLTECTLTEIAECFGYSDHSTVTHSLLAVSDRMLVNARSRDQVDAMEAAILKLPGIDIGITSEQPLNL